MFLLLISPAVGSFLGVLADRLSRGEDVVQQPSACRDCGHRLGLRDLVPLGSYLWQRGNCRHCAAPIPMRLFLIEASAVLCTVWAGIVTVTPVQMGVAALYLWVLLGLAAADAQWFRLPDLLTGPLALLGLALAWEDPSRGLMDGLIGAAIAVLAFAVLRRTYKALRGREGLGLGDVKLMAGIGAGVGAMNVPLVVLVAAGSALCWVLLQAAVQGQRLQRETALPFGMFLSLATVGVWLWLA
ncbi:MAG: A24 family peptidase [Pseudoruegeria sp.]